MSGFHAVRPRRRAGFPLASMLPATGQQWGDFAAASLLVSVPVVVLFVAFQKKMVRGSTLGAMKG